MVEEITPGDFLNIDEYVGELRDEGYSVEVDNLTESVGGFVAKVIVNGVEHATWDANMAGQMVRNVHTPINEISKKKIGEIEAGEIKPIDDYIEELREAGYDADYENVVNDSAGFVAKVTVNGELHATWEGGMTIPSSGHMVRSVVMPLKKIRQN